MPNATLPASLLAVVDAAFADVPAAPMPAGWDSRRARIVMIEAVAELAAQQNPRHRVQQAAQAVRNRQRQRLDLLDDDRRITVSRVPAVQLTQRQLQILPLVAQGLTGEEIGRHLHIGLDTVKTHLKHLYRAIGARNREHAVAIGFRTGVLRWEAPHAS